MRSFKRDPASPDAPADFWSWWSIGRDRVALATDSGGFDDGLIREISAAVDTIHPEMAWELAPGRAAQHAFCISPEGNAEVRQATLRWLATAPPPDATWEFHASKQPAQRLMGLDIGGRPFDLEETRAIASGARRAGGWTFASGTRGSPDAPERVRLQVAFAFLDSLLGEEDVERRVGEIDLLEAPTGGLTPAELKATIDRHKAETTRDETWVVRDVPNAEGHDCSDDSAT